MSDAVGADEPDNESDAAAFSYRRHKDGRIAVDWYGKTVTTLAGNAAARFLARVEGADAAAAQLLMAKATGNFKRGYERRPTLP